MPINISAMQTFSDTDMVTLFRWAIAQLAISESVEIEGRKITRSQLPSLMAALQFWEQRVNDTLYSQAGGNVALVQFGSPSYTINPDGGSDGQIG